MGVLKGASQGGSTSVQVFVKQGARLDTVYRGAISDFLKPINDLGFLRIGRRSTQFTLILAQSTNCCKLINLRGSG